MITNENLLVTVTVDPMPFQDPDHEWNGVQYHTGKCDRCESPSSGWHSCPYASEINDDDDPEYCNCCDDCTHGCCMGI